MWSDLAFHLNVISGFLYGVNRELSLLSRPQSLIFSGHALSYPFIPDYHAASLVAAGAMRVRWAIMLPSIFVMVALVVLLYSFLRRFLVSSAVFVCHSHPYSGHISEQPVGVGAQRGAIPVFCRAQPLGNMHQPTLPPSPFTCTDTLRRKLVGVKDPLHSQPCCCG